MCTELTGEASIADEATNKVAITQKGFIFLFPVNWKSAGWWLLGAALLQQEWHAKSFYM